ncbi:MAG: hypothetical protein M3A44_06960 [Gammaproteobacteria bacterium]
MELPIPLSRLAECPACRADLHVCRLCAFYDPRVSNSCREPVADAVKDKERANFCGYFQAQSGAYNPRADEKASTAKAQLEAIFGSASLDSGEPSMSKVGQRSEAEAAREQLERLFGLDNKHKE